jgi:ribosomal 30S subunit maturation factor RimM
MAIDDIEGKDIVDSSGTELGDVDEVVKNKSNQRLLVVGLKDTTKEVAVPMDKFTVSADGKNLTTRMTRAEMLTLPDYDPLDMESVDE